MSKKTTINLTNERIDIEEVAGAIYVHKTSTVKDFRGQVPNHPTETLLALSEADATALSNALSSFVAPPAAPAPTPAPESSEGNAG
jgi:hypothetical protein